MTSDRALALAGGIIGGALGSLIALAIAARRVFRP